jgi:nucleotide-binding universal stress UspA family protein
MKKIIAAFDSLRFSDSTLEYAIYLAKQYDAHIVGVFLRESTRIGYAVYATMVKESASGKTIFDEIEIADQVATEKAITEFETACREAKINFTVHKDKKNALDDLRHESIFADLLVIDAWETFSYIETGLPGWFIKNILHDVHCPVLVVPKNFNPVKKIVLLYDGTPSSVHAIKMFNYILPEMGKLEAELLSAKQDASSMHLPDNKLIKEWMKRHYPKVTYEVMKGDSKEITAVLKAEDPGVLVIAGSYHRSNISMWFHKSLADLLIKEVKAPLFIAHI